MSLLKREVYSYALAAVNFYGIITLRELATVINHYSGEEYTAKDLEEILESYINEESFVQKTSRILYQKQMFENTDVRIVYQTLIGKPLYLPKTSEEFLNYIEASYYELPTEFEEIRDFYTEWTQNADMGFLMAKDAVMAFNVDTPVTDMYEAVLARLNDYLKLTNSEFFMNDQSRNALIILMINLNNAVRKISLRGYTAKEINEKRLESE